MKNRNLYFIWMASLILFIILGLVAVMKIFVEGHGSVFHADDNIPWTLLIAAYLFFVLTSTGLTFISSLSLVFRMKKYYPIAKRAVFISIAALIAGFISIGLELGSPLNAIYYIIRPNFSSALWWMGFFYGLKLVFISLKFWRIQIGDWDSKLSKFLGVAGILCEIAAFSTLGSVFGLIEARPAFFGEYVPTYFLFTAALSGLSAIILISLVNHKISKREITENESAIYESLSKIFALVLGITIIFSVWRSMTGLMANRVEYDVVGYVINSWAYRAEILLGLVVPFTFVLIPTIRRTFYGKVIASLLVLIGLGIGRMDLVMSGQLAPTMPKVNIDHNILFYFPTVWEWVIGLFALAVMLLIYTLGEKYLNLADKPKEII